MSLEDQSPLERIFVPLSTYQPFALSGETTLQATDSTRPEHIDRSSIDLLLIFKVHVWSIIIIIIIIIIMVYIVG